MEDMVNISLGTGGVVALLGYLVVFFGLVLLMLVVMLLGKVMVARMSRSAVPAPAPVAVAASAPSPAAPGTAGELKLYDTDPRDAAMVMAIVADSLGKPLNQLRFLSIREVK